MTISIPITPQLVVSLILGVPLAAALGRGWYLVFWRGAVPGSRKSVSSNEFVIRRGTFDYVCCVIFAHLTVLLLVVLAVIQVVAMFSGRWFFWDVILDVVRSGAAT